MILRPYSDAELISVIAQVLSDEAMHLDARAMVVLLLARRDIAHCPLKTGLADILGQEAGVPIGSMRIARMVREAVAVGHMRRAAADLPRRGRQWVYSFIIGRKIAARPAQDEPD